MWGSLVCECLADAGFCEVCGAIVSYQDVPDVGLVLMHLADHGEQENGVESSTWELHTRESCLDARKRHWALLLARGISRSV
jgi:hypothetical protein